MTIAKLTELTADLLIHYYENDIQPFLDHLHKDVLWIGPAQNQMIRSKEALVKAFGKEKNTLRFEVYNLTAIPVHIGGHCTEVLLTFIVDTFWPDGGTNRVYQRISFAWEMRKDKPLIHCCHISNSIDYDVRDHIYPIHYLENHNHMVLYSSNPQKLYF